MSKYEVNYYVILKLETSSGEKLTAFSRAYVQVDSAYLDKKKVLIRRGRSYKFVLHQTNVIKTSDSQYAFMDFTGLRLGEKKVLNNGEIMYVCANTYKDFVFN